MKKELQEKTEEVISLRAKGDEITNLEQQILQLKQQIEERKLKEKQLEATITALNMQFTP